MLTLTDVSKIHPNGVVALAGLSLSVAHGEAVVVVGPSGCGKSTLLRLVAGLDRPTAGAIAIDGEPILGPHPRVGVVFQEPRLLPWLTVADNAAFMIADRPKRARRDRALAELAAVGLADKADAWPRELSGGQAQRVALARAMAADPEVLILDEPFSALDPRTRADLGDQLAALWTARPAAERPTLVMVTHDVDEALALADRVLVMRPDPGRIVAEHRVEPARAGRRRNPALAALRDAVLADLDAPSRLAA